MRINTGAAVPEGADSVVQVEDTKLIESSADAKTELVIEILKSPARGQDIRYVWIELGFIQLEMNLQFEILVKIIGPS